MKRLLCLFGFHKWEVVFRRLSQPQAQDHTCSWCGKKRHTTYDMCYGETTTMPGHYWTSMNERV